MRTRGRQIVASAVVAVLSGTPLGASVCALWCPPPEQAPSVAAVTSAAPDASAADAACAAIHQHAMLATAAAAAPDAADRRAAVAGRHAPGRLSAALPIMALESPACCDLPAVAAERTALTSVSPMLLAPAETARHPVGRDAPSGLVRVTVPPRPALARTARALVLRI